MDKLVTHVVVPNSRIFQDLNGYERRHVFCGADVRLDPGEGEDNWVQAWALEDIAIEGLHPPCEECLGSGELALWLLGNAGV